MNSQAVKNAIVLVGPTAVGKTAFSIELARHFQTAILSADSRQCFRELNIGVAKPSPGQLGQVTHYFINSHAITESVNASLYEQWSLDWVNAIFEKNDTAIVVGGTGLYIRAFCEGLDEIPAVLPEIREQILAGYGQQGMPWLTGQVKMNDPVFYETGEILNPRRMMRALEVKLSTGRSILSFRQGHAKNRPFTIQKFGLALPKDELHRNIDGRVDQMMEQGLLEEVRSLAAFRRLNALQTVGYSELFAHLDGDISLDQAIQEIKKNTRRYAKRQMTWFKKDPTIQWITSADLKKIIKS